MAAIRIENLAKKYGAIVALDGISLEVEDGEVFGFLGPNGAGKTTTIRILLGLIKPSSGSADVLTTRVGMRAASYRADVGYLPGELTFWPNFSGASTLQFLEHATGRRAAWRDELVERLRFSKDDLERRVGTYSDGMRQKLGIIQALQCAPKLALLDEPTKGLDPLIQHAFYELLIDIGKRGTTIFFSSHVLPEVERVCDRVAMLRSGRLLNVGHVDDLRKSMPRRVAIAFSDDRVPADAFNDIGQLTGVTGRRVELLVAADRIPALISRLASMMISDVTIEPPRLEDAFMEKYR